MKDIIKDMAIEAGMSAPYGTDREALLNFSYREFADLIIKECVAALWHSECHTSDEAIDEFNRNSKRIKHHFGC